MPTSRSNFSQMDFFICSELTISEKGMGLHGSTAAYSILGLGLGLHDWILIGSVLNGPQLSSLSRPSLTLASPPISISLHSTCSSSFISNLMVDKEFDSVLLTTENKVASIFTEFMSRVSILDELVNAGKRFLVRFNQELGYFRRPQINKDLKVIGEVIKSNMTERLKSYLAAGCTHSHHNVQNLSQLHNCMLRLQDFLKRAKASLDEIEHLAEDAYELVIEAEQSALRFVCERADNSLMNQTTSSEDQAEGDVNEKSVTYATMMRVIYSMLKFDYMMQEKIVGCLSLNSSLSELDTYCQMWDLRPYVDDSIMRHAWKSMSC